MLMVMFGEIIQFKGGIEGGYFYYILKIRELDEVVGDIFYKIMGMIGEN